MTYNFILDKDGAYRLIQASCPYFCRYLDKGLTGRFSVPGFRIPRRCRQFSIYLYASLSRYTLFENMAIFESSERQNAFCGENLGRKRLTNKIVL